MRAMSQDADDRLLSDAQDRRTIIRGDTLYRFYVADADKVVRPDITKRYFWFKKDTVLSTVGDFGGRVLNGEYKVYYPDKSLKEAGQFRYGLKDGDWKTWNPDGSLQAIDHWKKGEERASDAGSKPKKKKKHADS
jgi:hypothetical protein